VANIPGFFLRGCPIWASEVDIGALFNVGEKFGPDIGCMAICVVNGNLYVFVPDLLLVDRAVE
jgi:hypothetical protein